MKIKMISIAAMICLSPILGLAQTLNPVDSKKQPIEIVSDRMEAFNEKRVVIFSGHAVATQGDMSLQTDTLSIYYQKADDGKKREGQKQVQGSSDLDRIEAKGNVVVTQKDMRATSNEAVYYEADGRIVMTGNAVLKEGQSVITGCRVILYLNEGRGRVEPCIDPDSRKPGRVRAVLHPQEESKPEIDSGNDAKENP